MLKHGHCNVPTLINNINDNIIYTNRPVLIHYRMIRTLLSHIQKNILQHLTYYTRRRQRYFTLLMKRYKSLHISCIFWMSLLPVRIVSDARTRRIPVDFSMSRHAAISAQVMPPITQITTIFGDNAPRWPFTTQPDKFIKSSKLRGSFS